SFKQKISDNKKMHYVRVFKKGFLSLGKDQWLYLITVPSQSHVHHEDGLTLAIDQDGVIYQNHGHVCSGVVRFGSYKVIPKDSKTFFSTFLDAEKQKKWYVLDHNESR
ncbi:hypothetical protein, partial [Sulfurovum sp.]|uniref:hypothetical protein n=1 Tax=Sulfurovum sp. TaxID=1969726 RepID=UPI0025D885D1